MEIQKLPNVEQERIKLLKQLRERFSGQEQNRSKIFQFFFLNFSFHLEFIQLAIIWTQDSKINLFRIVLNLYQMLNRGLWRKLVQMKIKIQMKLMN